MLGTSVTHEKIGEPPLFTVVQPRHAPLQIVMPGTSVTHEKIGEPPLLTVVQPRHAPFRTLSPVPQLLMKRLASRRSLPSCSPAMPPSELNALYLSYS